MKFTDILQQKGLFSKEIKTRMSNNQITINGLAIKSDMELDIQMEEIVHFNGDTEIGAKIVEPGDVIVDMIRTNKFPNIVERLKVLGFEDLFGSNIKNSLTDFLNQFLFVRISKKEFFLLEKV